MNQAQQVISTILKHENKVTSYKIALLRAINDIAFSFPDVHIYQSDIAIPLKLIAEYWFAYYWVFTDPMHRIHQGNISNRDGIIRQDISFRKEMETFHTVWEKTNQIKSSSSEGFSIINEFRIPRRRKTYPTELHKLYDAAIKKIIIAIRQPIQYSGETHWGGIPKTTKTFSITTYTIQFSWE